MELKGKNLSVHYGWIVTVSIFLVNALVALTWLAADMTTTTKKINQDDAYIMSTILPDIVNQLKEVNKDKGIIRDRQNIVYERMAFRDSTFRLFQDQVIKKFEISNRRDTRIENYLKLQHYEFQNDHSLRNNNVKPFGEKLSKKDNQLTLKE